MGNELEEKMSILKNVNNDDTNFVVKALEAYIKNKENFKTKIKSSTIILKQNIEVSRIN